MVVIVTEKQEIFEELKNKLEENLPGRMFVMRCEPNQLGNSEPQKWQDNCLLLLDIDHTGGNQPAELMRKARVNSWAPVLAVVNYKNDKKLLLSTLEAGAADYIYYPLAGNELTDKVRQMYMEKHYAN